MRRQYEKCRFGDISFGHYCNLQRAYALELPRSAFVFPFYGINKINKKHYELLDTFQIQNFLTKY